MVFFQAVLLAGYSYAHAGPALLGDRRHAVLHLAVLLLPLLVLPILIPDTWKMPSTSYPVLWLLGLLMVVAGLPFFAVACNAPLLQRWFAGTGHPSARDPYFLYAASNLGSLLALLSYPFVIEPALKLHEQSRWWFAGYGLLVVLAAACVFSLWLSGVRSQESGARSQESGVRSQNVCLPPSFEIYYP
jgi:hypothetical protein